MEKIRCFIAVDLPAEVKHSLHQIQLALRPWDVRIKWVEKENFHLTLKFMGDTAPGSLAAVEKALERVAAGYPGFVIQLKGLGAFPNLDKPKVVWTGIANPDGNLHKLQAGVENALAGIGFPPEVKCFSPHMTLGRVKEPYSNAGLQELIDKITVPEMTVRVEEFKLMQSKLSGSGPVYSCLETFALTK